MAVFRVEKTKDFTIMSNHHLRNTELSLKAKGLLSLMLSLPEDWDYTTKGLAHICKDGVDSITTALKELERHGYLTRQRLRYDNGQLGDIEYTIHEQPVSTENIGLSPKRENPRQVKPEQAKPKQAEPEQENPAQLNTNPLKTKKSKKDKSLMTPASSRWSPVSYLPISTVPVEHWEMLTMMIPREVASLRSSMNHGFCGALPEP